jgi:hypothetical protein
MVTIAADPLGSDRVRPVVEERAVSLPVLIDDGGVSLGNLGLRVTPSGLVIDPRGRIVYERYGTFEVHDDVVRDEVETTLDGRRAVMAGSAGVPDVPGEALQAVQEAATLYRRGDVQQAVILWKKALAADPENYILSSSIWAAERPGDFYPAINTEYRRRYAAFMDREGISWRGESHRDPSDRGGPTA